MYKIIVIEDEPDVAKVLTRRLMDEGYSVVSALDAYHGFSMTRKENVDLVVLDLMLPAGGGLSVLKNMRACAQTMNLPVVVITGMKNPDVEAKVKEEGVEAYFLKPYDFDKLNATIKALLEKKQK